MTTTEQLRSLRVGQGSHWGDVKIYEHNRVPVQTAATYEALFPMMLDGRFDLFPRSAIEVTLELAYRSPLISWLNLQLDLQVVVHPNTDPRAANALVTLLRLEVAF